MPNQSGSALASCGIYAATVPSSSAWCLSWSASRYRCRGRVAGLIWVLTGADGGSVYLVEDDRCSWSFALILNDTLGLHLGGASGVPIGVPAPALYDSDGSPNHRSVVTHCALARESVRIDDAYSAAGFDFAGARAFDQAHGYRSRSFLAVPMIDHSGEVNGVLQLVNARSRDGAVGVFTADDQAFVEALTSLAAIALDKQ